MSNDQPVRRPPAKSSGGGAPMGSTISIVIAVVAVIVGFLILRNINDDGGSASGNGGLPENTSGSTLGTSGTDSTAATTATSLPAETTATSAPLVVTGGTVIVANASNINGAAGLATKALSGVGFTMGDPTNAAAGPDSQLAVTKVYFAAGAEVLAASVAQALSSAEAPITPEVIPTPPPVTGGTIGDAVVLVMVGTDLAGKPLPIIAASAGSPTGTTVLTSADISTSTSGG